MEISSSSSSAKKVRVLVVDDSALMRQMISDSLSRDPGIEVVGVASDPFIARERIKLLNPDVLTLDINMPKMDGLTFLEKIMTLRPMPVVMISTLTEKGAKETLDALEIGAVDYVTKPTEDVKDAFQVLSREICLKVKTAARANLKGRRESKTIASTAPITKTGKNLPNLVAIGASTGGVEALSEIFMALPDNCPPIIVVQHMPPGFTASFAARMDRICQPAIHEASHNMRIEKGNIYIAPGSQHLRLKHAHSALMTDLLDAESVSGHKPSVDVLFESVSDLKLRNVFGVILTGMGRDGAKGLLKLRQNGAKTFGQNEKSCLVYGMPRAAKELGSVEKEVYLKEIAPIIMGNTL